MWLIFKKNSSIGQAEIQAAWLISTYEALHMLPARKTVERQLSYAGYNKGVQEYQLLLIFGLLVQTNILHHALVKTDRIVILDRNAETSVNKYIPFIIKEL